MVDGLATWFRIALAQPVFIGYLIVAKFIVCSTLNNLARLLCLRALILYVFIYLRKLIAILFTNLVKIKFRAIVAVFLKLIFHLFVLTNFDIAYDDVGCFLLLAILELKVVWYTGIRNGILWRCQVTVVRWIIIHALLMLLDNLVDLLFADNVVNILVLSLNVLVNHHDYLLSIWACWPFALLIWTHVFWAVGANIVSLHPAIVVTQRKHWTSVRSASVDYLLLNTQQLWIISHARRAHNLLSIRQELAFLQDLHLLRVLQRRRYTLNILVVFLHDRLGDVTASK
jgi:hypothetical protein